MEPQRHCHQPPIKFYSTAVPVAWGGRCSAAALAFAARWGANCFCLCSVGNSCIPCHYEKLAATDWARSKYFFSFFYRFGYHFIYHFFHLCFHSFFYHFTFHFLIIIFNHFLSFLSFFLIIFSSSGAKKNPKNGKLQFSPSFFSFFYHFFLSFLLPVVELMKNDEKWWKMKKKMKKW